MTANAAHLRLAHGNGGRLMRELIDEVFARRLANAYLDTGLDAVTLAGPGTGELMMTTDGFTVRPLEFPGGDIGSLAVHGTVNDLAVAGAQPRYLALNVFAEEGLERALLERVVDSLAAAAAECGVAVVAGDTKVVARGEAGGLYLATTGIGWRNPGRSLGMENIRAGDKLIVSGPVGDHGTAVMLAREDFGMRGDLRSDSASVLPATKALLEAPGLRFMRDPTRGGLATVAHEIARQTALTVRLDERRVPISEPVQAVCELLGLDPYYMACEGRVLAVVAADGAEDALARLRAEGAAPDAAIIGEVQTYTAPVLLDTELGGERILDELSDDPLPRIC